MTYLEWDIQIRRNGNTVTFDNDLLQSLRVSLPTMDVVSAFEIGVDNEDTLDIREGDTIEITIANQGAGTKIIAGEILKAEKRFKDGDSNLRLIGKGWDSLFLYRTVDKEYSSETGYNIVIDLVADLVNDGLITTTNVEACATSLDLTFKEKTVFTALKEVADLVGYDFYLDSDKDLHFFLKEKYSSGETLTDDELLSYTYTTSAENIINRIWVIGAPRILPEDSDEWTEDTLDDWSAVTANTSVNRYDNSSFFQPVGEGDFSIGAISSGPALSILEFSRGCTLNLTGEGAFQKLSFFTGVYYPLASLNLSAYEIRIITSGGNYFYKAITSLIVPTSTSNEWRGIDLDVGPYSTGWSETGSPDWAIITAVSFRVTIDAGNASWIVYVDYLRFKQGRYRAFAEDGTSQSTWGVRTIPNPVDGNIKSNSEAQSKANAIIAFYKDPIPILDKIVIEEGFETFAPGDTIIVDVPEGSIDTRMIDIVHTIQEGDYTNEIRLSHPSADVTSQIGNLGRSTSNLEHTEQYVPYETVVPSAPPSPDPIDTIPPDAPTGLTATGMVNEILLEWTANTESDFHHYEVYKHPSNDSGSATKIAECLTNYIIVASPTDEYGVTQYFWIKAVDISGNVSGFSTGANASALYVAAIELRKGIQAYNSDIEFTPKSADKHDSLTYTSGDVVFADGTSQEITGDDINNFDLGISFVYFIVGNTALQKTTDYSNTIGDNVGLLATVQHSSDGTQEIGIFPFMSKGFNVISDIIAAQCIFAEHIVTETITADKLVTDFIVGDLEIKTGAGVVWTDDSGNPGIIIMDEGIKGKGAGGATMIEILATTGKITAGAGQVILDDQGITLRSDIGDPEFQLIIFESESVDRGWLYYTGGYYYMMANTGVGIRIQGDTVSLTASNASIYLTPATYVRIAEGKTLEVDHIDERADDHGVNIEAVVIKDGLVDDLDLGAVTAAEFSQLETIAATTISAAQWGYLGGMTGNPIYTGADAVLNSLAVATYIYTATDGGDDAIKVGDDAWIRDIDTANVFGVQGASDPTQGGIIFGSAKDTSIYRGGTIGGKGILKTSAHFYPESSAQDQGSNIIYWGEINAKDFTDRGCLFWADKGIRLADGRLVSDTEALKSIKMAPWKSDLHDANAIDYRTIPPIALRVAKDEDGVALPEDPDDPRYRLGYDEEGNVVRHRDGVSINDLVSILIGSIKELDNRLKALEE